MVKIIKQTTILIYLLAKQQFSQKKIKNNDSIKDSC